MFSARYSSGSSGLPPAYSPSPAINFAWCSSKLSEIYLRKIRPRTTCLYSAASILLRSLSAASQSLASKPILAEELLLLLPERERDINRRNYQNSTSLWSGKPPKAELRKTKENGNRKRSACLSAL